MRSVGETKGCLICAFIFISWHCRYGDVNEYEKKAPHAKMAHPSPEHFYPLHVALGVAGDSARARLIHRSWEDGHLSYASYRFSASL